MSIGKVIQRSLDPDRTIPGTYDGNTFLNTMFYEVESPNRDVKEYAANIIANNILTQVESDGYYPTIMEGIIYYKRDYKVDILKSNMFVVTNRGHNNMSKTTVGCKLLVKWIDDY